MGEDIKRLFEAVPDPDIGEYYVYKKNRIEIETYDFVNFDILEKWNIVDRRELVTVGEETAKRFLRAFGENVKEG